MALINWREQEEWDRLRFRRDGFADQLDQDHYQIDPLTPMRRIKLASLNAAIAKMITDRRNDDGKGSRARLSDVAGASRGLGRVRRVHRNGTRGARLVEEIEEL